ncbi:MAG: two-component regulator propeller domain-containing protein, partial [Fidelibacterota bacterium]
DPSEPTSLINNTVWNVYCDRTGVIWCSTAGGLSRYDAKDNTFRNFEHDPFNPQSISSNNVVQVFEDKRRNLWVGTIDMGLNIYDRNNNIFHRILHDPTDEESCE